MSPLAISNPRSEPANFLLQDTARRESPVFSFDRAPLRGSHASAPISATILTKNSAALLGEVLSSLAWCDEVVVFDTGSTDTTLTIAASFANVSLHQLTGPFPGFGRAHQQAVALARFDWILSIDSDEVVSVALRDEIARLTLDSQSVYVIPFQNYFNGKHITTCGWSPDRHERLFNRAATNFCASEVHERVQTETLSVVTLQHPIQHYSYRSLDDFLRKMTSYGQLFARQHVGRKSSSPMKALTRSLWAFFKSYVLERGIFQGTEGLVISAYKAQTVFWKYLMLHEANVRRAP
ncbi:MAG: glycosyltransferase family 2 protein [Opitutaceae bacterium]